MTTQPNIALPNFIRLSGTMRETTDALGPLAGLSGTWFGSNGWNSIAVPAFPGDFTLLVRPIIETITFTPIGALVPDRGGEAGIMQIPGLHYELQVTDAQTNQAMHIENGMWLLLQDAGTTQVARMCTVPHGNSVLAMGTASRFGGAPVIPNPLVVPDTGKGAPTGYSDGWHVPTSDGFVAGMPNEFLLKTLGAQIEAGMTVTDTVTLDVTTQAAGGGILNIPFITANADCRAMTSTFWLETMDDGQGGTFLQLQYSQQVDLFFVKKFDDPSQLIKWPHVTVNTLVKQ
jgi:hypothetical protein